MLEIVSRSTLRLLSLTSFYLLFLVIGASIFSAIEQPKDVEYVKKLQSLRSRFLSSNQCHSAAEDLDEYMAEVINAYKRGVIAIGNTTMEPNWSFGQSLFFAATIVTTIGYGHVAPLSEGGKLFCIVFAILGIPLTLILLTAYVERLMIPTTLFLQFLNSRLGHLYQPFNIRVFHLCIVVTIVIIFFFLIPAAIFATLEPEWDFLDSLYYCIISLTTIGLGDYVPGDHQGQPYRLLYKICTTVYLLIGLTFMMLMLTMFYDIPQLNFGLFFLLRSDEQSLDPEKMCLHNAFKSPGGGGGMMSVGGGPKYAQQIDEPIRESIRIKSRSRDMSSPEDGRP
ncbi:hypothetical protein CHUAL_006815 [Chamberlinius hualienensis]